MGKKYGFKNASRRNIRKIVRKGSAIGSVYGIGGKSTKSRKSIEITKGKSSNDGRGISGENGNRSIEDWGSIEDEEVLAEIKEYDRNFKGELIEETINEIDSLYQGASQIDRWGSIHNSPSVEHGRKDSEVQQFDKGQSSKNKITSNIKTNNELSREYIEDSRKSRQQLDVKNETFNSRLCCSFLTYQTPSSLFENKRLKNTIN